MVNINAGDDGAVGINQINRIKPSAHAYFKYDGIKRLAGQAIQNRQGGKFKIAQRNIAPRRFNSGKVRA